MVAVVIVNDLCDSEVRDLNTVFMYEYVFGFDVAMDDVPIFQELQCDYYLGYESTNDLVG